MKITAHVGYGHPNGQRMRAGLRFEVAPNDYDVTPEQYAEIAADSAIVVTNVHAGEDGYLNVAELTAIATGLGIEVKGRIKRDALIALIDDKRAEIAATEAAEVSRASQGQTAAEQEAADALK